MSDGKRVTPEDLAAWTTLAEKQMKGRPLDDLVWHTPEDIAVKPLYTALDTEILAHADTLPGQATVF